MIRLGTLFWVLLVSATGFAMFAVKYQVQGLDDDLAQTKRATATEEREVRVLDAEWAYLTRPEMLQTMNRQFLSLVPVSTKQLRTTVVDIPMRPPPPTPPAPPVPTGETTVVASAETSPPPSLPSAPEGVPGRSPAATAVVSMPEPPPTQSALRVMPALLEKPAGSERPAASPALPKAVPVKAVVKPPAPHRAKSLDDLISQIMASR